MKTFIAALALSVAFPAVAHAQASQAEDHAQHQGMNHDDCCDHKKADGSPMDCCKEKDGKHADCCQDAKGHDKHAGHEMSH